MGKRELLFSVTAKDLRLETFRAGGPGGQNQNKRESAVRFTHPPSGAVGESRAFKSQAQNKVAAFRHLVQTPEFRAWHRVEAARHEGRLVDIDARVERLMRPENIRVEFRDEGVWVSA